MFDATGYDFEAEVVRIMAKRRDQARAMTRNRPQPGGFQRVGAPRPMQDEGLRARSIAAAKTLQEIGELERALSLPCRAGDALY